MRMNIRIKGFTLLEIILVVALILFLFGISMPVYQTMLFGSEVESGNKILVSTLRKAQTQSMASVSDAKWGVKLFSNNLVLFKGDSYDARDSSADSAYTLPATFVISGPTEIVFSKKYGIPSATGTITLSLNGKTANILINSKIVQSY